MYYYLVYVGPSKISASLKLGKLDTVSTFLHSTYLFVLLFAAFDELCVALLPGLGREGDVPVGGNVHAKLPVVQVDFLSLVAVQGGDHEVGGVGGRTLVAVATCRGGERRGGRAGHQQD